MPIRDSFYPAAALTMREPEPTVPQCGRCGLLKTCITPKMRVSGEGKKGIMVVGEAPGAEEDKFGEPFVGQAGQKLHAMMGEAGINLRRDCWITNALICRPKDNVIKNEKAIDWCRPNVIKAIEDHSPTVIILLGKRAARSVIGRYWKDDVGGIKRWAGQRIPCRKPNVWICPTFHPSFIMRLTREAGLYEKVFTRHLKAAGALAGAKPWDEIPDYKSEVELVTDHRQAARILRKMIEKGGTIAFDYETDRLKPDHPDARIVCAAVCWQGEKTIAYPWDGEAVEATRELLASPLKKIAANLKFEHRWSRSALGERPRHWNWDTMQQQHVIDSRHGITGLKFQAFVRLGQEDYDSHLDGAKKTRDKGGNSRNDIRNVPLPKLLEYCGLDALLTYKIAMQQMAEMGIPEGF